MGRIERQVYDSAFEKALNALGLDARGVPTSKDWEIDSAVLRTEVRNLRGITTHPQVGVLVDRNDKGLAKVGGLKSIEEVLDVS
jgi:E3 ubiquitin-protein ligase SHPRH